MNVPVSPTVELAPLANLAKIEKKLAKRRSTTTWGKVAGPLLFAGAGFLAWRFAPQILAAARPQKRPSRAPWIVAGLGLVVGAGLARWQLQRIFSKEPEHDVEEQRGALEIRRYAPFTMAHSDVTGGWDEALNKGFDRLARFIFGGNESKKRIEMTSPVTGVREGDGFRIGFVMPHGVTPPAPLDERIHLTDVPGRRVAVLRFNGRYDAESVDAKKRELVATAEENGLRLLGEPSFAGYDPPWTIPVLRRNEVWVEVE